MYAVEPPFFISKNPALMEANAFASRDSSLVGLLRSLSYTIVTSLFRVSISSTLIFCAPPTSALVCACRHVMPFATSFVVHSTLSNPWICARISVCDNEPQIIINRSQLVFFFIILFLIDHSYSVITQIGDVYNSVKDCHVCR